MRNPKVAFCLVTILLSLLSGAQARIKLVALPQRGDTVIRLDNLTATLVEEERILTLQEGLNQVDFSWKGVQLDPDSIRLRIITHPDEVNLLNVSYPPNESALVWQISSPRAREEKIRVSYLLSGISRLVTYKTLADKEETKVDIKSYLVLRNFSGEDFEAARVQFDYGEAFEKDIRNEETKRMLFLKKDAIPIEKTFTFDAALLPWEPERQSGNVGIPVHYVIKNNKDSGLGEHVLSNGKVRIYQDDGNGSAIFLGEDNADYTPVGDKMKLYLGDSRDLVVTQRQLKNNKINIVRNSRNNIILYDTDEVIRAGIENFKDQEAVITIVEHISGQWDMEETTHKYERKDANTLLFRIKVPPRGKQTLAYRFHRRNVR